MASKKLVRLANAAAKASMKAAEAQRVWVDAFVAEYGHGGEAITAQFIEENSLPGHS